MCMKAAIFGSLTIKSLKIINLLKGIQTQNGFWELLNKIQLPWHKFKSSSHKQGTAIAKMTTKKKTYQGQLNMQGEFKHQNYPWKLQTERERDDDDYTHTQNRSRERGYVFLSLPEALDRRRSSCFRFRSRFWGGFWLWLVATVGAGWHIHLPLFATCGKEREGK